MKPIPSWQYDEMVHPGVDFADPSVVADYDLVHQRFRNYQASADTVVERLGITPHDTVIDLGCGTGAFCLYAAPRCQTIHAVDVSLAMLNWTRDRARERGLTNIRFHHGGFLTYEHAEPPADAVVSVAVLHHLPDFWKGVALRHTGQMLRLGGRLYLSDVVIRFDVSEHQPNIEQWVNTMRTYGGNTLAQDAATTIRDEYPTWEWAMQSLLTHAGFQIDQQLDGHAMGTTFLCTRAR